MTNKHPHADPGYGDPNAPIGSAEWAKRWRLVFQSAVKSLPDPPHTNREFYEIGAKYRAWTLVTDEEGMSFPDFDSFCRYRQPYGLGTNPHQFRAYLAPGMIGTGAGASPVKLPLALIRTDGGTQPRAVVNEQVVADYAEAMSRGDVFLDPDVFFDGEVYWLADGFHRIGAAKKNGREEIDVQVHQGTRRDAVLFALGANQAHGLRRSDEDKWRAVQTLLRDDEWCKWSDREIARRCGVGHAFVSKLRTSSLSTGDSEKSSHTYTTKHGTTATMTVTDIGKGRKSAPGSGEQLANGKSDVNAAQPETPAPEAEPVLSEATAPPENAMWAAESRTDDGLAAPDVIVEAPGQVEPTASRYWRRDLLGAATAFRLIADSVLREANAKVSERAPAKVVKLLEELRYHIAMAERVVSGAGDKPAGQIAEVSR